MLSEREEVTLALEAARELLRAEAGVRILTNARRIPRMARDDQRLHLRRQSRRSRRHQAHVSRPEGTATILPAVRYFGDRLMAGVSVQEIRREVEARLADGRFRAPTRAGIAFMLSTHIVNVIDAAKGEAGTAPPHYMIYAPNVTNADLHLPMAPITPSTGCRTSPTRVLMGSSS